MAYQDVISNYVEQDDPPPQRSDANLLQEAVDIIDDALSFLREVANQADGRDAIVERIGATMIVLEAEAIALTPDN